MREEFSPYFWISRVDTATRVLQFCIVSTWLQHEILEVKLYNILYCFILQRSFSEGANCPVKTRKSFTFLMKFLTDLMPHESAQHIKVFCLLHKTNIHFCYSCEHTSFATFYHVNLLLIDKYFHAFVLPVKVIFNLRSFLLDSSLKCFISNP